MIYENINSDKWKQITIKKLLSFCDKSPVLLSTQTGIKDGKEGDCKKIFTVTALAVKKDNEVTIRIEGEDEDAAFMAMEKFMKEIL
jgi:phosphotransferase system HPr (HPr) family protein